MKSIRQWQYGFGIAVVAALGLVSAGAIGAGEPVASLQAEVAMETIANAGQHERSEEVEPPGAAQYVCSLSCTPCYYHSDCPLFEGCVRQCY